MLSVLKDCGTINATATTLNLTPSAISQQITALSKEIGAPLLMPSGRGVRLTPQAAILLDHARAIDHQLELARSDIAAFEAGEMGRVVVSAFPSAIPVLVAPVITRLRTERPQLQISVNELDTASGFTHLDACDVDIVVAVDFPEGPLRKNKFYRRFDLLHDTFFIAVADGHPLAGKGEVPVEDLSDQCWIMAPAVAPCRELTLVACMAAGFSPDIRHNVDNWNSVLALVAANGGVAFVPRLAVPQGGFPGVTLLKPSGIQCPSRHWFAVTRSGSENNPGILAVMEGLQDLALELDQKP